MEASCCTATSWTCCTPISSSAPCVWSGRLWTALQGAGTSAGPCAPWTPPWGPTLAPCYALRSSPSLLCLFWCCVSSCTLWPSTSTRTTTTRCRSGPPAGPTSTCTPQPTRWSDTGTSRSSWTLWSRKASRWKVLISSPPPTWVTSGSSPNSTPSTAATSWLPAWRTQKGLKWRDGGFRISEGGLVWSGKAAWDMSRTSGGFPWQRWWGERSTDSVWCQFVPLKISQTLNLTHSRVWHEGQTLPARVSIRNVW